MALTDMPFGLKPLFMTEARKSAIIFPFTNNYGTACYVQDPALAVTAGTIERGSTTGALLGVILGIYKKSSSTVLNPTNLVPQLYMSATPGASDTWFALVACDPSIICAAQEDSDTSSLVITNNFGMVDLIYTHGGSTTTGISKAEIDSNTIDATATRPIQLVRPWWEHYDIDAGVYDSVSAAGAAGNRCRWLCRIANHQFRSASLSVGFA